MARSQERRFNSSDVLSALFELHVDSDRGKCEGIRGEQGQIHGCGDADHDAFWLLLPNEYRFDSFEVKAPEHNRYDLQVDVGLIESGLNSSAATEHALTWSGRMSDAVSVASLKRGQFAR